MDLPPGLALASLMGASTAVPALWALRARRLARTGQTRRVAMPYAASLTLFTLAAVLAWITTGWWPDSGPTVSDHIWLGRLLGLPAATGALLLVAALLELADQVAGAGARLRLTLESLTVASGLFVPVWGLVLLPDSPAGHHRQPGLHLPVVMATALACLVVGLSVVGVVRAQKSRPLLARLGGGASLTAIAMASVAAGCCYDNGRVVSAGALLLPVGAALWLRTPAPAARAEETETISPSSGLATGLAPVVAISLVTGVGYLRSRGIDPVTMLVGIGNGLFLVGRQYLAFVDVRRANNRLAASESHFRELAHTDALTGLANRRGLMRALYRDVTGLSACAMLILDLDGFKNVNDMRGHDVGDAVLIEVAQRLRLNLRPGDLAARLGGDEFAVLLWGRPQDAATVAQRLLAVLSQPYEPQSGAVFISASIGLAGFEPGQAISALLRNADLAQRAAKQRGKNRVEIYDQTYDMATSRRLLIQEELRGAIVRDELTLAFQPVVALPSVRPVGAEALLRWNHPSLGQVSPGEFIPIAEESGQIEALGAWVLQGACRRLSGWLADGHDVWVSVNVSPRELHLPHYVARVKQVLHEHRVPPSRLVLEVTEHAIATDVDQLLRSLAALRSIGVRIALDDFGAGYSSLGQLQELPVDILKIDHKLVDGQGAGGTPAPLVDIVVRLGQRLGLQVIAEGICEPRHRKTVEAAGCPYGQGFLFGGGVPADHLEAMLVAVSPVNRVPIRALTQHVAQVERPAPGHDTGVPASGSS